MRWPQLQHLISPPPAPPSEIANTPLLHGHVTASSPVQILNPHPPARVRTSGCGLEEKVVCEFESEIESLLIGPGTGLTWRASEGAIPSSRKCRW
jgi:hypothetical protein